MTKTRARQYYLKLRSGLTKEEIDKKSELVTQQILSLSEVSDKSNFGLYLATKGEVDTKPLIDKLISQKKEVFLPRFFDVEKAYHFVKFLSWDDLEAGYYGIMQPKNSKKADIKLLDAVFIPGVAFDKSGVRLGWGTGVYDRLLGNSKALKIGLAYDFQIAKSIPREKHDLKADLIVSEKRVLKIT